MKTYLPLLVVGLIPIVVTTILYWLDKKVFTNVNYWIKQVMYGLIFAGIAILGTEYSVHISGANMNVRDAAPLCAGLFFGAPAAIIAGTIGGIERYVAVYWGAGTLTRLACSLGTFFSGIIAAIFRKIIFDDKNAKPVYGFALGIISETLHMLLIMMTNSTNVESAFNVVKACTIPMVLAVAISVAIASIIVSIIDSKNSEHALESNNNISTHFQKNLLILMTISFLLTNSFCVLLQKNLSEDQTNKLLQYNLQDTVSEVSEMIDEQLLSITESVTNKIEELQEDGVTISRSDLIDLEHEFNVSEIDLVGDDNIIYASTVNTYLGYDMTSAEQSNEFAIKFSDSNTNYFVQETQSTGYDVTNIMKYAAYRNDAGGYIQVAYDADLLARKTKTMLSTLAHNRRIGQNGSMIIANANTGVIISDFSDSLTGYTLTEIGFNTSFDRANMNNKYEGSIAGTDEYYSFYVTDGYVIIVMQPVEEATFNEYIATYLMSFVEISVFTGIFIIVYFLIKNSIVKNVNIINNDLEKITEGNLDTIVDVRDTVEFSKLSDHINTTVSKLKELISDVEKRMEKELNYAAEIQRSSLPIDFPDEKQYEIYASMDPAKEVGGDFYDFYMIDGKKLCILIADVSGKGIPASLFMMRAKTQIKAYAEYGIEVNDIFTNSNFNLTEGNDAGLFVTAWMGIIDLTTGHMCYANAGHNPPLIQYPNGKYEYLPSKPGFVLGGMEGIVYKKFEMDLQEGTNIFLYTDGLTEAQNINSELYGEQRLQDSINKYTDLSCKEICINITKDIASFVGEADQFDDMTMLSFKFKKKL